MSKQLNPELGILPLPTSQKTVSTVDDDKKMSIPRGTTQLIVAHSKILSSPTSIPSTVSNTESLSGAKMQNINF